jgi:hypothetical protein
MMQIELGEIKWKDCKKELPKYDTSGMCLPISNVVMLIIGHESGYKQIVGAVYDGKQKKWLDPYFNDVWEYSKEKDREPLMWAEMPKLERFEKGGKI